MTTRPITYGRRRCWHSLRTASNSRASGRQPACCACHQTKGDRFPHNPLDARVASACARFRVCRSCALGDSGLEVDQRVLGLAAGDPLVVADPTRLHILSADGERVRSVGDVFDVVGRLIGAVEVPLELRAPGCCVRAHLRLSRADEWGNRHRCGGGSLGRRTQGTAAADGRAWTTRSAARCSGRAARRATPGAPLRRRTRSPARAAPQRT